MNLANVARVVAVLGAVVAAAGSASNQQQSTYNQPNSSAMTAQQHGQSGGNPPPAQEMEGSRALGVWRSTFGAVKIEADDSRGGIEAGSVQGVWVYQRRGEEVIGYFSGTLRGNVLQFKWQEPSNPPLTGSGYLVFDRSGRQYSGRWWSDRRDRVGDWNGWRNAGNNNPYDERGQPADDQPYDGDRTDRPTDDRRDGGEYGPQPPAPSPRDGRAPRPRDPQPPAPAQPGTYGPQPPPTYY